ncbi:hypothetical protein BD779DRAFT_1767537 [Infundibulicybe gibba]|nr:hypothetical protein BD779DRAFT_1767537 [Infundibulicybe gibba]
MVCLDSPSEGDVELNYPGSDKNIFPVGFRIPAGELEMYITAEILESGGGECSGNGQGTPSDTEARMYTPGKICRQIMAELIEGLSSPLPKYHLIGGFASAVSFGGEDTSTGTLTDWVAWGSSSVASNGLGVTGHQLRFLLLCKILDFANCWNLGVVKIHQKTRDTS